MPSNPAAFNHFIRIAQATTGLEIVTLLISHLPNPLYHLQSKQPGERSPCGLSLIKSEPGNSFKAGCPSIQGSWRKDLLPFLWTLAAFPALWAEHCRKETKPAWLDLPLVCAGPAQLGPHCSWQRMDLLIHQQTTWTSLPWLQILVPIATLLNHSHWFKPQVQLHYFILSTSPLSTLLKCRISTLSFLISHLSPLFSSLCHHPTHLLLTSMRLST